MHSVILGTEVETRNWYDQHKETSFFRAKKECKEHQDQLATELTEKGGEKLDTMIKAVYTTYRRLVLGKLDEIPSLDKIAPIFVVGLPRSGGTYITKQLFKAVGIDYKTVSYTLGHDGMPSPEPVTYSEDINGDIVNSRTMFYLRLSEFIVMATDFYLNRDEAVYNGDRVVFPKKLCNLIYDYNMFKHIFPHASYIVTYRNPRGFLGSMMDKSGVEDPTSEFRIKIAIERWAEELLLAKGHELTNENSFQYYQIMVNYHKHYYQELARSGILSNPNTIIAEFGKSMEKVVPEVIGMEGDYDKFFVSELKRFPGQIMTMCRKVDHEIKRILGLKK
jgi:hypothetical protein